MINHRWSYCDLCEHEVVICGKCGNNTCNGGYGEVDGKECDACPSAYDLYLGNVKEKETNAVPNAMYIAELRKQISAIVAGERTDKPTDADIIAAFSLLIEYLETDE
jgi:hypothetical protein